jgi:hypothetical protein
MYYPDHLYEPNPDRHLEQPLRINRLKKNVQLTLVWQDLKGVYHTELFRGKTALGTEGLSYVHESDSPEKDLRAFLQHCPIHDIHVELYDY